MFEYPFWSIKSLEKAVSEQLSERNFIFDTIYMCHAYDALDMTGKILIVLDGDIRNRIIFVIKPCRGRPIGEIIKYICDAIIGRHPNRVRYRKYKVYCQHCGAPIQPNEPNCPYCGQPYVEFNFKEDI